MGRDIKDIITFIKEKDLSDIYYRMKYRLLKKTGYYYLKFYPFKLENFDYAGDINNIEVDRLPYFQQNKNKDLKEEYLKFFNKKDINKITEEADRICNGNLKIYNFKIPVVNNIPQWHTALDNGKKWTERHWTNISLYGKNAPGDCRTTWELNRLYYFHTLGRAYLLTAEEKYLDCFKKHLNNWLEENPPEIGINWYSNLEVAIRALNLFWSFLMFKEGLDEQYEYKILNLVSYHLHHVRKGIKHTEKVMNNNHLLGEAAVLYYFALVFNNPDYLNPARDIFMREIKRQFYSDGGNFEGSSGYHKFSTYFLIIILSALKPVDKDYKLIKNILYKALSFISTFTDENYIIPVIGDWDGANIFKFNSLPSHNIKGLLSHINLFYEDVSLLDEEFFWLFGDYQYGDKKYKKIEQRRVKTFSKSGYTVISDKKDKVIFKAGNHGLHGHSDQLSLLYNIGSKPFLIDTGTYIYNNQPQSRRYFRSTRAHNTLLINEREQNQQIGTFQWGKTLHGEIINVVDNDEHVIIESLLDYKEQGFKQTRVVFYLPEPGLAVVDIIEGEGINNLKKYWHINPEWEVNKENNNIEFLLSDKKIYYYGLDNRNFNIYRGSENFFKGWYAPEYGGLEECWTIEEILNNSSNLFTSLFISDKIKNVECKYKNDEIKLKLGNKIIDYRV